MNFGAITENSSSMLNYEDFALCGLYNIKRFRQSEENSVQNNKADDQG